MEPFGPENSKPVFVSQAGYGIRLFKIAERKTPPFIFEAGRPGFFPALPFNMAEKWPLIQSGQPLDVAYTLDVNEWNGEKKLQLKIHDIKLNAGS